MSAYVVDRAHIDALLTAGLYHAPQYPGDGCSPLRWFDRDPAENDGHEWYEKHHRELTRETADAVGRMLWWENLRSVGYRYPDGELPAPDGMLAELDTYTFNRLPGIPDPVVVLSAIACYEYQTCEHPGWHGSEAQAFCSALKERCIRRLPGWDDAPWEVTMPDIFIRYERELAGLEP
jgi:hypothetical protein